MSSHRSVSPRTRGGIVGGACAITGIGAHAAGQGALPTTATLLILLAAAVAIGTASAASPALPSVVTLAAGQGLSHLILSAVSGQHHDLVNPAMLGTHLAGTLAALCLLIALNLAARAIGGRVHSLITRISYVGRPPADVRHRPVDTVRGVTSSIRVLGGIGLRAPPLSV